MAEGIKLVVVGDGAVGKTCLLVVYAKGEFPTEYVPTVFENYSSQVTRGDETVDIQLWDTAGQEELETIRCLSYPNTDVFLMCFSLVEPTSLANLTLKWLPELKRYVPSPKIMLVGTKSDLRNENNAVSKDEIKTIGGQVGSIGFFECSAARGEGVKEIFEAAIDAAFKKGGGGGGGGCCNVQ
jgi:small GTP-binding protein